MGICIENKSSLKENLTYLLPSVRAKLLITVCLEIPCTISKTKIMKKNSLKLKIQGHQKQTGYICVGVK